VRKEQLLIIAAGIAAVFLLYFFGKTIKPAESTLSHADVAMEFSDYESLHLRLLPDGDAGRIRTLKSNISLHPTLSNYLAISKAWEEIGNYPLGAFYYQEASRVNEDSIPWEASGDKLYNSYLNYGDSLITNNLITFALASYEQAYNADKANLTLRMKLAEAYVESPEPMKGILHLRAITDSIPDYVPALLTLGRLSLKTGQYEKAEKRLLEVLKVNPANTEALYFLALTNEGLGNIDETIRLLEMCIKLVDNPAFTLEITNYIERLKN